MSEKPTVNISDSRDPDKLRKIAECHVYIVLADDGFFESAQCFAEVLYAKDRNKPFRVLLKKGTKIDKEFFEGVEDIKFYELEDPGELRKIVKGILDDFFEEEEAQ